MNTNLIISTVNAPVTYGAVRIGDGTRWKSTVYWAGEQDKFMPDTKTLCNHRHLAKRTAMQCGRLRLGREKKRYNAAVLAVINERVAVLTAQAAAVLNMKDQNDA